MSNQLLALITDQVMMSSLQVGAVFFIIVGTVFMVLVSGSRKTRRRPMLRPYDEMKLRQAQNR